MDANHERRAAAAVAADLAGAVERWAADLPLTEEPARFLAALEEFAPGPAPGP